MDLLERYLQAVRYFLPRQQQDDIVRELSENLISQMEEREAELGRPLTADEQADILRRHGHPLLVAGQYRSQRQLIGPVFFPLYLTVLKAGLVVALLVTVVLAAVSAVLYADPLRRALDVLLGFPGRALMVFAWTTLGFAALDWAQARLKLSHKWDPRTLPKCVRHEHRLSRGHAFTEFLAGIAGAVWLLLLPKNPFLLLGPAAAFVDLAPIWSMVYVPLVAVAVATVALSLVDFLRPFWTPLRSAARLTIDGTAFVVFVTLAMANQWVVAKPGAALPNRGALGRVVDIINAGFEIGFVIACIICLIEILRELHRLRTRRRTSAASNSAAAGITR
jgi:hypothetical protein